MQISAFHCSISRKKTSSCLFKSARRRQQYYVRWKEKKIAHALFPNFFTASKKITTSLSMKGGREENVVAPAKKKTTCVCKRESLEKICAIFFSILRAREKSEIQ